jgi:hypothetical protein
MYTKKEKIEIKFSRYAKNKKSNFLCDKRSYNVRNFSIKIINMEIFLRQIQSPN